MIKLKQVVVIILLLITIFSIGNGYAIATNLHQSDFKVRFTGEPRVSNKNKVQAMIENDLSATVNVTSLSMDEKIETVEYIVENASKDLSAELLIETTNNNSEYFLVESKIEKNILKRGEATKVIIKIELIKTPQDEAQKAIIGIKLNAKPIQPTPNSNDNNSNNNQSSGSNNSNTVQNGYYEKDDTPKTGSNKFIEFLWR